MRLFKFEDEQNFTADFEKIRSASDYNKIKKGKWYHWERVYLISSNSEEFGLVSFNFFERMGRNLFKIDYFKDRKILVIPPKVLKMIQKAKTAFQKVSKEIEEEAPLKERELKVEQIKPDDSQSFVSTVFHKVIEIFARNLSGMIINTAATASGLLASSVISLVTTSLYGYFAGK